MTSIREFIDAELGGLGDGFDTEAIAVGVAEFLLAVSGIDAKVARVVAPFYDASVIGIAEDLGLGFFALCQRHRIASVSPINPEAAELEASFAAHPAGKRRVAAARSAQ